MTSRPLPSRMWRMAFAAVSAGWLVIGLLWLISRPVPVVRAAGPLYVDPAGSDGNTCSGPVPANACRTIAHVVSIAPSDATIYLGAGTYLENVSITGKVLTFIGAGMTTTIVDGGGIDRVFNTDSDITLADLTIQNGNDITSSTGMANGGGLHTDGALALTNVAVQNNTTGASRGGGAYAMGAMTVSGGLFQNNTSVGSDGAGGGLYANDALVLTGTRFVSNSVNYEGGGVYANGIATLSGAQFENNLAHLGGGLYAYGPLTLTNTEFLSNTAQLPGGAGGGGVHAGDAATLSGDLFQDNTCIGTCWGGGLYESGNNGALSVSGTRFIDNTASAGGGLFVQGSTPSARVVNALFAGNQATTGQGDAIRLDSAGSIQVLHTTVDSGGSGMMTGAGIYVAGGTVNVADTILSNFPTGIQNAGGTVSADYDLFYGNDEDTAGAGVTVGANNQYGDPDFVSPAANDYHLSAGSPAIDNGENVQVTTDLDGSPRPMGGGYDIGAYEYSAGLRASQAASADPVIPGSSLTYTLWLTNTSATDLNVVVTDTLPGQVSPTGPLTWTTVVAQSGGVWTQTVVVTVTDGYSGTLANQLTAVAAEGPTASATLNTQARLGDQTITFGPLPDKTLGDSPVTITATASSGLAVTFTTTSTTICSVSGNTVTLLGAGSCDLIAHQAGNANFNAASPVTQSFTVTTGKLNQTITFGSIPNRTMLDPTFFVSATASSGLEVSFSTTSTACSLSDPFYGLGYPVNLLSAGDCVLVAHQAGNATYNPAPDVTQTFTISKVDQTITFAALPDKVLTDPSFGLTATASSGLPVDFATNSPACTVQYIHRLGWSATPVSLGDCAITASQPGNDAYNAAPVVTQTFAISRAWTLMFYLNGDNNLNDYQRWYFNELEAVANNPAVQILALWDQGGNNAAYYEVQFDSDLSHLATYTDTVNTWSKGNLDMGDPQTLVDFADWARSRYPAQHYALVMSDHGSGLGGAMWDDTSGHHMTVKQIGSALDSITNNGASKLDVLYLQACLMGMLEDTYQWRNDVDYYVASEDVMWASWVDYRPAVQPIDGSTTPAQAATLLATDYAKHQQPGLSSEISVADLSKLGAVVSATNSLALAINPLIPLNPGLMKLLFTDVEGYSHDNFYGMVDLGDFARLAYVLLPTDPVKNAAQSVLNAIHSYIIFEGHDSSIDNYSQGVSIFFPTSKSSFYNTNNYDFATGAVWSSSLGGTAIHAQDAGAWGAMLVTYFQVTQPNGPDNPNPPPLVPLQVLHPVYLPLVRR